MSNTKLPALKDALDLLNQTQEVLGRFVANHRNPSEKDTISELLGLHDCAAGYAARKAVSETLALLADRERQAGEAVAYSQSQRETAYDLLDRKLRNTLNDADYAEMSGALECLFASLPAPQAVQAGWKLVPVEPTDEMEIAAENDYEQRGETFPDWKSKWRAMLAAAPSPDGKADNSPCACWPGRMCDRAKECAADSKAEQAEAPSDSTLKLAEMILSDCGHSTAISTRLRDRVAERIERHIATQPTASNAATIQPWEERVKPDFPNTDPRTWKSGVSLGFVESHMKDEIDELRAALASKPPAGEQKPIAGEGK